jgi:hypothetical protein
MCNGKYGNNISNLTEKRRIFVFSREIMSEVFIQCGNFIMVPNQLKHLDYDSGK